MKFSFVLIASLLFVSSCEIHKADLKRGYHPEEYKGVRSVYVKDNEHGQGYSIYKSDRHDVPSWCNIKNSYASAVKSFNENFIKYDERDVPTFFVCYSGNKPTVNSEEIESSNGVVYKNRFQQTPFLQEEFSPYSKLYLIGIVLSGGGRDLLPEYFDLYKEFCLDDNVGCCMVNSGQDIVFNIVIEGHDDVSVIEKTIKDVKVFIDNKAISEDDVMVGYNLFKSTILDKCSFERWYYDSIYMNIARPEFLLDYDNWLSYFKNENGQDIKIKGVGVKIIDSNRLPSQESSALKVFLNRLTGEL